MGLKIPVLRNRDESGVQRETTDGSFVGLPAGAGLALIHLERRRRTSSGARFPRFPRQCLWCASPRRARIAPLSIETRCRHQSLQLPENKRAAHHSIETTFRRCPLHFPRREPPSEPKRVGHRPARFRAQLVENKLLVLRTSGTQLSCPRPVLLPLCLGFNRDKVPSARSLSL